LGSHGFCYEKGAGMMNTEKQIEFDKIKELWMGFAVTEKAR